MRPWRPLLPFLGVPLLLAAAPPAYVNTFSLDAANVMRKIAGRPVEELKTDAERMEWARARLAWIALARLQGQEAEALKIFSDCGDICGRFGPEKEWDATRSWGCGRQPGALPCAPKKTKAQKPSS